jgi:hypothetical protein
MTNKNFNQALNQAFNEACNEAWQETWAELTPEELEAAKKITLTEWVQAFTEVGLEIGAGFAQMLKR